MLQRTDLHRGIILDDRFKAGKEDDETKQDEAYENICVWFPREVCVDGLYIADDP